MHSTTGFFVQGGTIAGNGTAVNCSNSTCSAELSFTSTQFFGAGNAFDFTAATGSPVILDCIACHLENQPSAANAHFIQGNVDGHVNGGQMVDDNPVGTADWFVSTGGNKMIIDGVSFASPRTVTTIVLANAPTTRILSGHLFSAGHFTNYVTGANAANFTVEMLAGSSLVSSTPWTFASQLRPTNGLQVTDGALATLAGATVDFSATPSVINSTTGVGAPNNTTCVQTGQEYCQTDGTAGQEKWFCKAGVWSQQLNSGAGGASVTLNNLGTTANNADLLPSGTRHLGATTTPWADIFVGSASAMRRLGSFPSECVMSSAACG